MKEEKIERLISVSVQEDRTELHLSHRKMKNLPLKIREITSLRKLDLSRNNISIFPSALYELENLKTLSLNLNKISRLPNDINKLSSLENLYIRGNLIEKVPDTMKELSELKELDIRENPLPKAPPEIIDKTNNPQRIIHYFLSIQDSKKKPLNEAKLIIVGQGGVGKTSLVKRIISDSFDKHESKTDGINIDEWIIRNNRDEKVRVNIWDFGGQEIMHSTHQFFLTKRSFYVIVIDARQGENESKLEYWLKMVRSFGDGSPAIVVINKIDQHPLDLNKKWLKSKYPFLLSFFDISCKTNSGIDVLNNFLSKNILDLDHIDDELPSSWFKIKEQLSNMDENYISYDKYKEICTTGSVASEFDQESLVELLHDLGIVINFIDDVRINDTNVLNPEWVTNGVYKILNSFTLFHSHGVLDVLDLTKILDTKTYPRIKHQFLVNLMEKFELCYKLDKPLCNSYLIPDLLRGEEPDYSVDITDSLSFEIHYDLLPNSIISRLIVRLHDYIYKSTVWRTGAIFSDEFNKALVKSDSEDKKIYIWVSGLENTRRSFLFFIRKAINSINKTIPSLDAKEKVIYSGVSIDHTHLLNLERLGEKQFIPEGLNRRLSVKMLLDGVDDMSKERNNNGTTEIIYGDKFVAENVISQGNNNELSGHFNQQNLDSVDINILKDELRILREYLQNSTNSSQELIEAAAIAQAEEEASNNNINGVSTALKRAGNWSLSIAEKIGIPVATAAIKSSTGL